MELKHCRKCNTDASDDKPDDGGDGNVPDTQDDPQPKKSALKILSADALMREVSEAQISFTWTDPKINYLILNYAGPTAADREPILAGIQFKLRGGS